MAHQFTQWWTCCFPNRNKFYPIRWTAFTPLHSIHVIYLFWQDIKGERLNMSFNSETRIRVTSRQRYQIYAVCWLTLNSNGPFVINFICIVDCWAKIGNTSFRVYWRNLLGLSTGKAATTWLLLQTIHYMYICRRYDFISLNSNKK